MKTIENISLKELDFLYQLQTKHFVEWCNDLIIESTPYLHFEQSGIFHPIFYDYLKTIMPDYENLTPLRDVGKKNTKPRIGVNSGYPIERRVLPIRSPHEGHSFLIEEIKDKNILDQFIRLDQWFSTNVRNSIAEKFQIQKNEIQYEELLYSIDASGYALGVHTDLPSKVFTMLIYMPDDGSIVSSGTNMLVPKQINYTDKTNRLHRSDEFDIYKVTQFKPNNVFCFRRTDNSFHSVTKHLNSEPRKLLLYTTLQDRKKQ